MRNIHSVINQIIEKIPEDFQEREDLIQELEMVKRDAGYTAPEAMYTRWQQAYDVLNRYLAPLLDEHTHWVLEILLIWKGIKQ